MFNEFNPFLLILFKPFNKIVFFPVLDDLLLFCKMNVSRLVVILVFFLIVWW